MKLRPRDISRIQYAAEMFNDLTRAESFASLCYILLEDGCTGPYWSEDHSQVYLRGPDGEWLEKSHTLTQK